MRRRLFLMTALIASAALLPGCATSTATSSKPVVRIDLAQIATLPPGTPRLAKVELVDQRPHMEGDYRFVPSDVELIRSIVETKADEALLRQRRTEAPDPIVVALQVFRVDTTPGPGMEREVTARIRAFVRTAGQNLALDGEASEQIYTPTTPAIVQRVTTRALQQVAVNTEQAMKSVFAAKR